MASLWSDVQYAARMLIKNRGLSAIAILTLALGIGVNSAIFSVVNSLLLRPLPFKDSDRLIVLWNRAPGLNVPQDWLASGEYVDIKSNCDGFEDVAIFISRTFNLTSVDPPERVQGMRVSSSFFSLFGVQPAFGQVFSSDSDQPGKPLIVLISNELWRRKFGSDPNLVGRTVALNGAPATVTGIMPPDFSLSKEMIATVGGIERADVILPLPMNAAMVGDHKNWTYNVMARLKPGITVPQAQAQVNVVVERLKEAHPEEYGGTIGFTTSVVPLLEQVIGDIRPTLLVLFGAVGLVLLIACANVANLLLSQATARQKEFAIRSALGASRVRLIRQLLVESMLVALAGGGLGLLFSVWSLNGLRALGPGNIPRLGEIGIESRMFVFTFIVSLLTGLIFGLAPAFRASRINLNELLKESGRTAAVGPRTNRVRSLIVAFEIALSVVVLIGAGLLIRSFIKAQNVKPGFSTMNILSMGLALTGQKYSDATSRSVFYQQLCERLEQLPGIKSAGSVSVLPLSPGVGWEGIWPDGYQGTSGETSFQSDSRIASPNYFEAMGIDLIAGRFFNDRDTKDSQPVVLIDEDFARRFWPNENPIDKRIKRGDISSSASWMSVVGVVGTVKQYSLDSDPPRGAFYAPHSQIPSGNMYLVMRTGSPPLQMVNTVTGAIRAMDSELPVYDVKSMEQRLSDSLGRRRFSMLVLSLFAVLAGILAAVGIYGVVSYLVTQRTHEVGVRMALGAQPSDVLRLVVGQGMRLTAVGIIVGVGGALLLTRFMSTLVYGVNTTDLLTFLVLPAIPAAVALAACLVPARRAMRIDPVIALRFE